MVTGVEAATGVVVIVKVAEVCPAGTVTEAGAEAAAAFELVMVTTAPPERAGPVR